MSAEHDDGPELCREKQEEEIEVLQSMYEPSQLKVHPRREDGSYTVLYKIPNSTVIRAKVPPLYPVHEAPDFEFEGGGVSIDQAETLATEMHVVHEQHEGEVSLFDCLSICEEKLMSSSTTEADTGAESNIANASESDYYYDEENAEEEENRSSVTVFHGDPVTEKKSTFQAHVATVKSKEEVEAVMRQLLNSKKIQKATHNINAYRFFDQEKQCWVSDNDDDGESGAGQRLAALLEMIDARDAIVVVSRWFGGTLLGPARFRYINNVAREMLEKHGYSNRQRRGKP
eukprot:gb/GECG01001082.1/.p1 GENE.gb/GECG01001082.1/~~gb/GECG01001082.1/.p1  ORF type:complete len:287 (+),score=62.24 gb/GECG01001082.1/:1-861(+)